MAKAKAHLPLFPFRKLRADGRARCNSDIYRKEGGFPVAAAAAAAAAAPYLFLNY